MAKKTKKRNKSDRHLFRNSLFVIVAVIGLLTTYEYYRNPLCAQLQAARTVIEDMATPAMPALASCSQVEIPAPLQGVPEKIIEHTGYRVSYNKDWKIPNWVAYELTATEADGKEKRTNKFVADPKIGASNNLAASYSKSGYDRGHMAPAADMAWSKEVMVESFYYSNMCPQHPTLNRGLWSKLESRVRSWAMTDSVVYVVTGVVVDKKLEIATIGENKVVVPNYIYKAVLSPYVSPPRAIAFVMKNEKENPTLQGCAISVDSLEEFASIDLFPTLPDEVEDTIEASLALDKWCWE